MKSSFFLGIVAVSAAILLTLRNRPNSRRPIAVSEAAERLRLAWTKNHTIA